jgi:hypothetical protein
MNRIEYLTLKAQQTRKIAGHDLFDQRRGRTLMYGEDLDGCMRHTYVDNVGNICAVVYAPFSETLNRAPGWAVLAKHTEGECSNGDFVPTEKVFAAFTDYEFASRMLEAGVMFNLILTDDADSHAHLYPPAPSMMKRLRAIPDLVPATSVTERKAWARDSLGQRVAYFVSPANGTLYVLEEDFEAAKRFAPTDSAQLVPDFFAIAT